MLVFTDQNFPAFLFSQDERACIGVVRVEGGTIKEIGFVIGDMLDGITHCKSRPSQNELYIP